MYYKFKVGDRVQVVTNDNGSMDYIGLVTNIKYVNMTGVNYPYILEDAPSGVGFNENELELYKPKTTPKDFSIITVNIGDVWRSKADGDLYRITGLSTSRAYGSNMSTGAIGSIPLNEMESRMEKYSLDQTGGVKQEQMSFSGSGTVPCNDSQPIMFKSSQEFVNRMSEDLKKLKENKKK